LSPDSVTHPPPQLAWPEGQSLTHAAEPPGVSAHTGAADEQPTPQAPQLTAERSDVVHPAPELVQSSKPFAQVYEQRPARQDAVSMFGNCVQSFVQLPQL
jgi:hypothetical protein